MTGMGSVRGAGDLLDAVKASPVSVADHDKRAWVGLFAPSGAVNDPVGSTPHVGAEEIGRFFDTFIAPNGIEFMVDHDVVAGMSVLRDLTVRTTMSSGATVYIPMHLRYELVEDGNSGALKIEKLFAHWELKIVIAQLLLSRKGILTALALGPRLVIKQGLGGVWGFSKGFLGVREAGKRRVRDLVGALACNDLATVSTVLDSSAMLSPDGVHNVGLAEFVSSVRGLSVDKLIAAGRSVTATIRIGDRRGVGLFEFSSNRAGSGSISAVRLYL
ncbi:steroid delta-isomerase [Mycobacteroides abscessus subsp. abscessus]|nr:steroid delta-isomerase [Mycobacteroides abscessus subsp. abscessus]SHU28563.1 steroid delta-isomerase [Mycobacteroides abscessus subsp. abscessus]SHV34443.1 steroid delta-isomerase [Mycobacteroides abscessus subsp. abscessus]SHV73296.1 steroid delta-isomerase [Mycobacteroides abscessus subsp. abscessus]SHX95171.1 steroid delta-isomerase [Mycobacteroides abscessus subsp. abscessus]